VRSFRAPRRHATHCEVPGADGDETVLGADLRYVLTDLSQVGDDGIRARVGGVAFAALAHLLSKHARADDLFRRLARWADLLRAVLAASSGLDALRTVPSCLFAVRGTEAEQEISAAVLPQVARLIEAAALDRLHVWLDRVVDARSLDELLEERHAD
jgi:hypothetical protein